MMGTSIGASGETEDDMRASLSFFPSPLVGEGGENERSEIGPGEGLLRHCRKSTPHPPSLREGTLSHKGRGK
jgi:hypothetical protein